jgi:hypothetical protein
VWKGVSTKYFFNYNYTYDGQTSGCDDLEKSGSDLENSGSDLEKSGSDLVKSGYDLERSGSDSSSDSEYGDG